jgi:hypothetical protein
MGWWQMADSWMSGFQLQISMGCCQTQWDHPQNKGIK